MKNTLQVIGMTLLVLAMLDVIILFFGLAQIALENRTGEWNGFWRPQAEFVVSFLK